MSQWGRDHWSTLAYLGHIIVHRGGVPQQEKMRTDKSIHPGLGMSRATQREFGGGKYPTRLKDGYQIENHDDWSCVEDMMAEGLVEWNGTGINPIFAFTDAGWDLWYAFERHIAEHPRNWSATFTPPVKKPSMREPVFYRDCSVLLARAAGSGGTAYVYFVIYGEVARGGTISISHGGDDPLSVALTIRRSIQSIAHQIKHGERA